MNWLDVLIILLAAMAGAAGYRMGLLARAVSWLGLALGLFFAARLIPHVLDGHVITGDANLSEIATYLKVGTTAIVLSMIEDDVLPGDLALAKPVFAMREVSHDLTLQRPLDLADGRKVTALDIQWELYDRAKKYELEHGLASVGEEVGADVMARWGAVLAALESDYMSLADQLDWVAKYRLFGAYRERNGLAWNDARLRAMDLQYHDLRPEKSLFARVGMSILETSLSRVGRS